MENKSHVPNHQPAMLFYTCSTWQALRLGMVLLGLAATARPTPMPRASPWLSS